MILILLRFFSNTLFFPKISPISNAQRNAIAEITKMTILLKIIGICTLFLLINHMCMGKIESRLRIGKTINVFVRYGYLGISMKVISYNDTERWLFKEPTYNVFRVCFSQCFPLFFFFVLFCFVLHTIVCVYLLFYCVWKVQVQIDNEFYIFKTFYNFIRELISWLKQRKKINQAHFMAIFIWNFAIIKSNYFKRILEILPLNVSSIHGKHLLADGIY